MGCPSLFSHKCAGNPNCRIHYPNRKRLFSLNIALLNVEILDFYCAEYYVEIRDILRYDRENAYWENREMGDKQLYVANVNVVFGKIEEPLIKRLDDIVLPALRSGLERRAGDRTRFLFENVCLKEISENNWVIQGILIKDTILDVMSEYTEDDGLQKIEKHVKSSPYSLFIIYLKNHRMILVKNQSGSPDIRSFSSTFKGVIRRYVVNYNKTLSDDEKCKQLPYPMIKITGIKTADSVKESLKNVEKIEQLVIKFYPLNSEWDYDPVFGAIDNKIRRTIQSKKGRMIFPSPQSKEGVAAMIESTEGLVKTELKVVYKSDEYGNKRRGKIKDDQISEIMTVEVDKELDEAYDEINNFGKDIRALNIQTENHIIDYNEFLKKHKM